MPYIAAWHQAPGADRTATSAYLHLELFRIRRAPGQAEVSGRLGVGDGRVRQRHAAGGRRAAGCGRPELSDQLIRSVVRVESGAPDGSVGRARPGQPDRRAHRLQRRLRAAVRAAARDRRSPRGARTTAGLAVASERDRRHRSRSTTSAWARSTAGRRTSPASCGRCGSRATRSAASTCCVARTRAARRRACRRRPRCECAVVAGRWSTCGGLGIDPADAGRAGPAGRERYVGVPVRNHGPGGVDAVHAGPRAVPRLPRDWPREQVPFDLARADGLAMLVVDTARRTGTRRRVRRAPRDLRGGGAAARRTGAARLASTTWTARSPAGRRRRAPPGPARGHRERAGAGHGRAAARRPARATSGRCSPRRTPRCATTTR